MEEAAAEEAAGAVRIVSTRFPHAVGWSTHWRRRRRRRHRADAVGGAPQSRDTCSFAAEARACLPILLAPV